MQIHILLPQVSILQRFTFLYLYFQWAKNGRIAVRDKGFCETAGHSQDQDLLMDIHLQTISYWASDEIAHENLWKFYVFTAF